VGGRFKPRLKQVSVAVVKSVEGSPKEAPGVPSCGGHAPSGAAEPFMASAAESVKRGVCPPARTARFIASQLWGLTHVQGLSVRPVGWLGVIRTSSEDPCPITSTAVAPLIIPEGHSGLRSGPLPWYRTSSPVCTVARPDVAGVASRRPAVHLSTRR
jgi:hypothetical protein